MLCTFCTSDRITYVFALCPLIGVKQALSSYLFYATAVKLRLSKSGGFNMNLILLQRPGLRVIE